MATLTLAELLAALETDFPDNTTNKITAEILRDNQTDLIESAILSGSNPGDTIYVYGDADTDGSLRFIRDSLDTTKIEIQYRSSGIWNTGGLTISGSTLRLGRELSLSGVGEFIQTYDAGEESTQLHPHIHYTDDAGSKDTGYFPVLGAKFYDQGFQTIDTDQLTSTDGVLEYDIEVTIETLVSKVYLKMGDTPTEAALIIQAFRDNSEPVGNPFYSHTYPAGTFNVAEGTVIEIELDVPLQFNPGDLISNTYTTADGSEFSLLGDSASGIPYIASDGYLLAEDPILSFDTSAKALSDQSGNLIMDQNGDMVFANVTY